MVSIVAKTLTESVRGTHFITTLANPVSCGHHHARAIHHFYEYALSNFVRYTNRGVDILVQIRTRLCKAPSRTSLNRA